MNDEKIEKIQNILNLMVSFEVWVARLYQNCAQYLIEDEDFWMEMASSELKHSENISSMLRIFLRKPEKFELGIPFKDIVLKTAMENRKEDLDKIKNKTLTKAQIFEIAKDIELTILESRYNDFLISKDEEYTSLVKSIVEETREHLKLLDNKLIEFKKS